jgi:putative hydrolase of the HAD superfamily
MTDAYVELIRKASTPLEPRPTGVEPHLPALSGVRAVLFDIYGTLLVSASGDIGAADPTVRGEAFAGALAAMRWGFSGDPGPSAAQLRTVIQRHHVSTKRTSGVSYPEVDIVEVWREVCAALSQRGDLADLPPDADYRRLAIEFETRVNPVWPMPGLAECLDGLRREGAVMGIISNAQFFTPLIFPAIVGRDLDMLGFASNLRYYSYMHGCAKPGIELYHMAARGLRDQGIEPHEVLYVGNDMRNDIWPAAEVGFRTVLFAGDERSLRFRDQDADREKYGTAAATVTDLKQILTLVEHRD